MAARRRRRQQLDGPPQLRFERMAPAPAPAAAVPTADDPTVRALRLRNDGGAASDARLVLFTAAAVAREPLGGDAPFARGEQWDIAVDEIYTHPPHEIRGYALAQGSDERWFATTIDGRTATFRSMPDELGVLSTLGLRLPLGAEPQGGLVHCERVQAETPAA